MSNEYVLQEAINRLDKIASQICDDYCRYPYQFGEDEQEDLDAICKDCPVNGLALEGVFA